MTDLDLTAERRRELVQLLDDTERLRSEYPKLLEYLELAPQLAGTGNPQTDAAFELRFVHFMTDQETSSNPYWDIVAPLISNRNGLKKLDGGTPNGATRLAFAQTILQETYAYAVPSPETVIWAKKAAQGRKLLEIGAGRGYWASQLAAADVEVKAFDIDPPDTKENPSFPKKGRHTQTWHKVYEIDQINDEYRDARDSVLFMCWPPGWENSMASEALTRFEESGGEILIYIGEPKGGKTADDNFFSILSTRWKLDSVDPDYVSWWNLNDQAQVWIHRS